MAAKLKQANELISALLEVLQKASPKNVVTERVCVEARALMKSNPEKLHELVKNYMLAPHRAKILACDDTFVLDVKASMGNMDILGLSNIWDQDGFSMEHKATVFYNLIELTNLLT